MNAKLLRLLMLLLTRHQTPRPRTTDRRIPFIHYFPTARNDDDADDDDDDDDDDACPRNKYTGSAMFVIALAWHDGSGSYLVTTLNSTAPVAKSVTDVAFVGADLPDMKWSIASDGACLRAASVRERVLLFLRASFSCSLCLPRARPLCWSVRARARG